MKIKNYWVVFGAILVFVVLVLCVPQESAGQTKEEILALIPQEWKVKNIDAMNSLADQIIKDNETLALLFKDGSDDSINTMTELYTQWSGAIVNHKYKVISSKDNDFKPFWKKAREAGPKLEFKTVSIVLTEKLGKQSVQVLKEGRLKNVEFNYVAFVVHEFSYGPNGAGGSTYDPPDSRTYAHQEECTWSGRG